MKLKHFKFIAGFELLLAAALWGFGFVAAVWALRFWNAAELIFLRFVLAAIAGLFVSFFLKPSRGELRWHVRAAFTPAFWLCTMLFFQTWGLLYTTATKSGMITILYVVLVPVFEATVARKKIPPLLWFCILVSLVGVGLIVQPRVDADWNLGDLLTLICSGAAALQILAIDRVGGEVKYVFLFNTLQSLWGCLLAACLLPFHPGFFTDVRMPPILPVVGLLSLGLGSTLIAFYLQVKAQKVLTPTVSSLFFLLESPFALLFAAICLGERLNLPQGIGAFLIMCSALVAARLHTKIPEAGKNKSRDSSLAIGIISGNDVP